MVPALLSGTAGSRPDNLRTFALDACASHHSVTICPTHEVSLEKYCPHCRQRLLLLSARARPGFCTHCNGWLGDEVPVSVESKQPTEDERWVARAVGELLALGTATPTGGWRSRPQGTRR